MEPCTIMDLGKLTEITDHSHKESIHMRIRTDILGITQGVWFLLGDACICYEPIGKRKAQVHIYSVSRDRRGKELRDFAIRCGRWMIDNTSCDTFLNFVDPDRRDIMIFMRMIGAEKIGVIPGTNQILYVTTEDMNVEEKL